MRWPVPLPLTALLVASATPSIRADLTWETKQAAVKADLAQKSAEFRFPYKNTGPAPIRILSIEASCGCMTSDVAPGAIPPGDTGVLRLTMAFEGRTGTLHGSLTVKTDSPAHPIEQLTVTASVPMPVEVHPTRIVWKKDEKPSPRSILLTVTDPDRTTLELVKANDRIFSATLDPGTAPGTYRVSVQVTDTSRPASTMLTIRTKTDNVSCDSLVMVAVK